MTILKNFFIKPFTEKGLIQGTLDLIVKLIAISVWLYLVGILFHLMRQSFLFDYSRVTQLWWGAYCFVMFFGASLIAYILIFLRDYNEEETEEEE